LVLACFSRSSVARSLASRASSSWVCVETACFLAPGSARALAGFEGDSRAEALLFVEVFVETVEVSVQLEEVVELRHEVLCDGPASWVRMRALGWVGAGDRTTEDGCLASSLASTRGRGSPWRWWWVCGMWEEGAQNSEQGGSVAGGVVHAAQGSSGRAVGGCGDD
jgi:hypothetical protein